jgi:predicted MPP superfamily phosphohydrolase
MALKYGHIIRMFFCSKIFGSRCPEDSFLTTTLNLLVPFILFSILVTLLSIPRLLHKGIVFNVLGYAFYYWFLIFPFHLFYLILKKQIFVRPLSIFAFAGGIILLCIFVLSLFYFPNQIKQHCVTFTSEKIKKDIRIVHISDIHAENFGSREMKLINIVNSLNADIILITGDMFIKPYKYNTQGFSAATTILDRFDSKYGIYLVEGHHDHKETYNLRDVLGDKINILNDDWYHLDHIGVSIFGATLDSEKKEFTPNESCQNFCVYLAHDPDRISNLNPGSFELALFGHTHGGQVYIPLLSYIILGKYRHGLYDHESIPVYVNAGIGLEGYLAPRIRLFTFPEVVVIYIQPPQKDH